MRLRTIICLAALLGLAALMPPAPARAQDDLSPACAQAVDAALSRRGYPYVWGAKGPNSFDCSGLTSWAYAQAGIDIGVGTHDQLLSGQANGCSLAQMALNTCWQPGDLIFLRDGGSQHVSLYIGGGLVVDAYNSSTGVIVHAAANDSYYQAHFLQGRRIANCAGAGGQVVLDLDSPAGIFEGEPVPDFLPSRAAPSFAAMPDLMPYVGAWEITQCGAGIDAFVGPEPTVVWYDLGSIISWLAYSIDVSLLGLTCWVASLMQQAANMLADSTNAVIYGINYGWRLAVFVWLYSSWLVVEWGTYLYEVQRSLLWDLRDGLQIVSEFFAWLGDGLLNVLGLLGQLMLILGQIVMAGLGWLGWLGGMVIAVISPMFSAIFWTPTGQLASGLPNVPAPLATTYPLYCGVRGAVDGLHDSQIGWVLWLMYGMAYVVFVMWLSRFLSSAKAGPQ